MTQYKTTAPAVANTPVSGVPVPVNPDDYLASNYARGVWIPLLQNLFGGLGVAGVLAVLLYKLTTWDMEEIGVDALLIGILVFCLATAVRAFRDEVRFMLAAFGERRDIAARQALQQRCASLEQEIKGLRDESHLKTYYETLAATETMLRAAYIEHKEISRAAAMDRGMTRAEWEAAVNMCKGAKVLDSRGKPIDDLSFEAAWSTVMHYQRSGQGHYVVARDGEPVRVK